MSKRTRIITALIVLAAIAAGVIGGIYGLPDTPPSVKVKLAGADETVNVIKDDQGQIVFEVTEDDGQKTRLAPDAFARRVHGEQAKRPWWHRMMNITSPAGVTWVALGFLGQLLFSGRMIVQWLVSERHRKSVVPTAFWWLALGGASMLLVYFVWRKDIVGIFGQSTGWLIYVRNLYFIYKPRHREPAADSSNA